MKRLKQAILWKKERKGVRCLACQRKCYLKDREFGFCFARVNLKNKLYMLNFGKIISADAVPIEKIQVFHFFPGTKTLAIIIPGNNMYRDESIFKDKRKLLLHGKDYTPEKISELAKKEGCKSITFLGESPSTYFEFAFRTAKFARRLGLKSIFVTNGLASPDAIKRLAKYVACFVVKVKASLDPEYYKKYEGIDVKLIYRCLRQIGKSRAHVEILNVIIPEVGDNSQYAYELALWISTNLNTTVPLHFLAFYPDKKFPDVIPTPVETLEKCISEARRAGLRYVYIGEVPEHPDLNTYCFNCRELVMRREYYELKENKLVNGRCPKCGMKIDIVED